MRSRAESMITNLQEKVKGMTEGGDGVIAMESTKEKLKQMGADDLIHSLVEKIKQLLLMLENLGSTPTAWFDKIFPPETRKEQIQHWNQRWILVGASVLVFTLLLLFCCCSGCLSSFFTIAVNILKFPFVMLWKIITSCIHGIIYILKAPFILFRKIVTCCLHGIRKGFLLVAAPFNRCFGLKMMKAPGRGYLIPRSRFEANPKAYFRGLRAGKY